MPVETVNRVLRLCHERYRDLDVAHFCDQLRAHHQFCLGYQWVKTALETAGLVAPCYQESRAAGKRRDDRRPASKSP